MNFSTTIRNHKRKLRQQEWHENSLDKTGTGETMEVQIVNEQLEGVEFECQCGAKLGADDRCHACLELEINSGNYCKDDNCDDCQTEAWAAVQGRAITLQPH